MFFMVSMCDLLMAFGTYDIIRNDLTGIGWPKVHLVEISIQDTAGRYSKENMLTDGHTHAISIFWLTREKPHF